MIFAFLFFASPFFSIVNAQEQMKIPVEKFFKGEVTEVLKEEEKEEIGGYTNFSQELRVVLLEGEDEGKTITITYGGIIRITPAQKLKKNDVVVVLK